jgi:transposase
VVAARKKKQKRMSAQVVEDEDCQLRYEVVAGIGVAKESAVVCVRLPPAEGRKHRRSHLQTVPATVPAITELAVLLKTQGVQMVSMEATSDYWRAWFAVLEEAGLAVQLVNSSQARNLPGRPKTGKEDARWIARLTEMGMLRSSFVPPPEIRALRVYTRHIFGLTADRTRYWQRLEKLLEDALCKLAAVVSKLAGHQAARAVTEKMIEGERDPRALAALGRGKMSNDRLPALAEALTGMRFGPEHAHAAASLLSAIDLLEEEIRVAEDAVAAHLAAIPASWGVDADGATSPDAGREEGAAVLPAADRLDEIPGLGREAAAALIAESGSPGASPRQGPLRTVRARHPGTRLKQAPRALRARVLASCVCGPGARGRRRCVSGGFGSRPACHARPGRRGSRRRSPCEPR